MLYSYIVKKKSGRPSTTSTTIAGMRQWSGCAAGSSSRFGINALPGERNDKEALRCRFQRLGRVQPNLHLKINNIWAMGWPGNTIVFVQWDGSSTLLNGSCVRQPWSLHVFTLRWGRVYRLEEFQDSEAAAHALSIQAAAGLKSSCR